MRFAIQNKGERIGERVKMNLCKMLKNIVLENIDGPVRSARFLHHFSKPFRIIDFRGFCRFWDSLFFAIFRILFQQSFRNSEMTMIAVVEFRIKWNVQPCCPLYSENRARQFLLGYNLSNKNANR